MSTLAFIDGSTTFHYTTGEKTSCSLLPLRVWAHWIFTDHKARPVESSGRWLAVCPPTRNIVFNVRAHATHASAWLLVFVYKVVFFFTVCSLFKKMSIKSRTPVKENGIRVHRWSTITRRVAISLHAHKHKNIFCLCHRLTSILSLSLSPPPAHPSLPTKTLVAKHVTPPPSFTLKNNLSRGVVFTFPARAAAGTRSPLEQPARTRHRGYRVRLQREGI